MVKLEYCDGSTWQPLASESYVNTTIPNLAVTSVAITGSPGLNVSGSPITGAGTIGLTLNLELQSLANLNTTGLLVRSGTATYVGRSLVAGSGISVTNGNGLAGNPTIAVSTIDLNNNTTGQLNIARLNGYPSNSLYFLNGNGSWVNPLKITTNDLDNLSSGITIKNTNSAATAAGLTVDSNITGTAVQFGFNNSTSEAYVWASGSARLKFGTSNIERMRIDATGFVDLLGNNLHTTGTVSTNNLASYNSTAIQVLSPLSPITVSGKIVSLENGTQVYTRASSNYLDLRAANVRGSKTSAIIETNTYGETASIVMNGDYIQTIQTFDDLGLIFTDEDYDPATTYQSYISANGSLVVSSSKNTKHSIQEKPTKDYLDRLNKLKVYSYAHKVPIMDFDSEKKKTRKYYKNQRLHVGLLAEEVAQLFDNASDEFKLIELHQGNRQEFKKLTNDYSPKVKAKTYLESKNQARQGPGVNYNTLLCYTILAIQELTQRLFYLEQKTNR